MFKLAVIIPAAGSGSRMGTRIPKPFLKLQEKTILEHTIRSFLKVEQVSQVIVATSREWISDVQTIFANLSFSEVTFNVVEGGKERQDSISKGLGVVSEAIELVAVHDAVRPFIHKELIIKCSRVALEFGGAIIAVPAKDTIKEVDRDSNIKNTPDRSKLWQAQTPQIFRKELLVEAYKLAKKGNYLGTDDASLVERIRGIVKIVEGDRRNLKITYPIDFKIAELILKERELE